MLNLTVTGKVVVREPLKDHDEYLGFMLLRITQSIGGVYQHAFLELYFPKWTKNQFDYFFKENIEYVAIVADKLMTPSKPKFGDLKVIAALSVNRIERN